MSPLLQLKDFGLSYLRNGILPYISNSVSGRTGPVVSRVLGIGEASPQVLCPVLCSSTQERHGGAEVSSEKNSEAGEGSQAQVQ